MVNAAFAPRWRPNRRPARLRRARAVSRRTPRQPAIVALPVPAPYSKYGTITNWQIDESLPDAIGAFVKWLVEESGWTRDRRASGPSSACRSAAPHLYSLSPLQRFGRDVTRGYVRALEARHVAARAGAAAAHSTSARRSKRSATRSPRSNGRTTSWRFSPRCTARCSRSPTARCCAFARPTGTLHPFRKLPARSAAASSRRSRDALDRARANSIAGATAARSPKRSRACSPPRARTPASRSGRPAIRRWPT